MKKLFRKSRPAKARALSPDQAYRYYKMMWEAAHPASTPAEYDAWVRKITKELGL